MSGDKKAQTKIFLIRAIAASAVLLSFLAFYARPNGGEYLESLLGIQASVGVARMTETFAVFCIAAAASLLFGRLYCSFVCPMGTYQEALWHFGGIFGVFRRGRGFIAPWSARYAVPILVGAGLIIGIPIPFIMTDPISTFGRGVSSVIDVSSRGTLPATVVVSLGIFAFVSVMSMLRGRRFCDWCPLGTVLGVASGVAPYGMALDRDECVSCGACEKKCPMNCIDAAAKRLDRSRCVLCLRCVPACPRGAMSYRRAERRQAPEGRREFLSRFLALAAGVFYTAGGPLKGRLAIPFGPEPIILPPGAGDIKRFSSRCIACQACVAACPVGIIKMKSAMQPELDYTGGYCQYNCTVCGAACPTEAIAHIDVDEKRRTRVAVSEFTVEKCVVMEKGQACGACAEVCPTRALRMEPYSRQESGLTIPVFDETYCIGCGACLYACPAEPRAFAMTPVASQTLTPGIRPTAEGDGALPPLPPMDDFPF